VNEDLLRNAQADSSGDALLYLLTITHADLEETLRYVRDFQPLISRGNSFTAFPFDVTPPGSGEGGARPASISISAVGQEIPAALRSINTPAVALIELVLASDPDTVVDSLPPFTFTAAGGDIFTVGIEIADSADDETEPLVQFSFDPSTAPALFR
jgi:hypothetical protein